MPDRLECAKPQAFRQIVRVESIVLVRLLALSSDVTHNNACDLGREQVVQPLRLRSFLEGDLHASAQPADQGEQRSALGRHGGAHDHAPLLVADAGDARCLVHIQREILSCLILHGSRSFRSFGLRSTQTYWRERAFNMR